MTPDQIIDGILDREGEQQPPYLAKGDRGGRTNWGISERAHPEVWMSGPPDRARARQVYLHTYVKPWDWLLSEPLKVQLIDITVLSGYARAVCLLQEALGDLTVDGVLGSHTRHAIVEATMFDSVARQVNNALVAMRVRHFGLIANTLVDQRPNLRGWINRAVLFIVE